MCKVYRRTLPIDYYENANGLVLRGENLDGSALIRYPMITGEHIFEQN